MSAVDTGLSKEGHEDTKSARTVESVWCMGGRAWCAVMGGMTGMTVAIREPERGQKRQARVLGVRTLGGGDSREAGILGNDVGGRSPQSGVSGPAASAWPGNLGEMQILRPHPRPPGAGARVCG